MSKPVILEDVFEVTGIDPDGKKFDKVSRIVARGDLLSLDLILDVNVEIYPVAVGDRLSVTIARTLNLDGTPSSNAFDSSYAPGAKTTLADRFEYVVHGRVFRLKGAGTGGGGGVRAEAFLSFGGLLAHLAGDPSRIAELSLDENIFLLARKV